MIFKRKCVFCKKRSGEILKSVRHIFYSCICYYYHEYCLEYVIRTPEKHSHKLVDIALHIDEINSDKKRRIEEEIKRRNDRLSEAKSRRIDDDLKLFRKLTHG